MTDRAFAYAQHARLVELGIAQPCSKEGKTEEPKQEPKEGRDNGNSN
jgi:hypothetical protein